MRKRVLPLRARLRHGEFSARDALQGEGLLQFKDTIVVPIEIEISLGIFGRIGTDLEIQFCRFSLWQICRLAREYHMEFVVVFGFCIGIFDACQHFRSFFCFILHTEVERAPPVVVGGGAGIIINLQTTHEGECAAP